jgi:glycerophosphoryl diester phosphodiesterase
MTMTRRDFAALTLATPLALGLAGGARAQARSVKVIATGGASGAIAAGTREAYELAIRDGADVLAADLVPCQDGTFFVLPDPELSLSTDVAARPAFQDRRRDLVIDGDARAGWFVQDFTVAELKSLARLPPAPPRRGRPPAPAALLTFDDLIAIARAGSVATARVVGVQAGLVHPAFFAGLDLAVEPRLATAIRLAGYNSPAAAMVVASEDREALKTLGGLTRARRALRLHVDAGPPTTPAVLAEIRRLAEIIAPDFALLLDLANPKLTPPMPLIANAHAAGLAVQAWTTAQPGAFPPPPFRPGDTRRLLAALIAAGADAVAGDLAAPIARARGSGD